MKNKEKIESVGKEYQELAQFISKEIFQTDQIQVGYEVIKRFANGGWIWSKMD